MRRHHDDRRYHSPRRTYTARAHPVPPTDLNRHRQELRIRRWCASFSHRRQRKNKQKRRPSTFRDPSLANSFQAHRTRRKGGIERSHHFTPFHRFGHLVHHRHWDRISDILTIQEKLEDVAGRLRFSKTTSIPIGAKAHLHSLGSTSSIPSSSSHLHTSQRSINIRPHQHSEKKVPSCIGDISAAFGWVPRSIPNLGHIGECRSDDILVFTQPCP